MTYGAVLKHNQGIPLTYLKRKCFFISSISTIVFIAFLNFFFLFINMDPVNSTPEPTSTVPNPNKIAGYQTLVPNFDGEIFSNVTYFLKTLEDIAQIAKWEDPELIAVFKSKLKGPALQFFIADPELTTQTNFSSIKDKFQNYFSPKTTLSHRQQMFSNCKQFPGESVRSFASRVSNLTITYFGQENAQKVDAAPIVSQTKLAKFLEGLNAPLRGLALSRHPSSFEDAVEKSILDELNAQMTDSMAAVNVAHCQTYKKNEENIENKLTDLLQKQAERSNQLFETLSKKITSLELNNRKNASGPRPCTHCGRTNHSSERCYSLRNDRYPRPSQQTNTSYRPSTYNSRNDCNRYLTPPNASQTPRFPEPRYNQGSRNQGRLNFNGSR